MWIRNKKLRNFLIAGHGVATACLHRLSDLFVRLSPRKKVYIVNRHRKVICCTMRDDDLLRMERYFHLNNYAVVHNPALADVLVLNTCAFDKEREQTCMELVKEFSQYSGELLVTGCVGKINEGGLRQVFDGEYISPPGLGAELDRFLASRSELLCPFDSVTAHGRERSLYDGGVGWRTVTRPRRKPRVGAVKVVNGCPQNCAYCTHKMSIGFKSVSVPLDRIDRIVSEQVRKGAEVVQLLGDNLGPYGSDTGSNIPELVSHLSERFPGLRYALDQYHAAYFVRDYPTGLKDSIGKGLIHELKMPIQSGSARILEAMNRRTNLERLAEYVLESARLAPEMLFVTHIITGFPTETEEDFNATVEYVKRVFNHNALVYIFPCSVHPETPAARLEPRVTYDECLRRALVAEKEFLACGIDVCLDQLDLLKERGECGYVGGGREGTSK